MRHCPFPSCGQPIPESMFACRPHWYSLNKVQRETIWSAYRSYLANRLSIESLRAIQQQVIEEATGAKA